MEKGDFEKAVGDFIRLDPGNYITKDAALRPVLAGMRIFDDPIFGYAAATDPLFGELKKPGIIGDHCMLPDEWLNGARTVISVFLPFSRVVKKANSVDMDWPADEWLHARIEGQALQIQSCRYMVKLLLNESFTAIVPMVDSRFSGKHPHIQDTSLQAYYTSNWSERHAAFICGIGTFGLSKGLISPKGVAGRFISLVTDAFFEPDQRNYTVIDEYCIHCGACVTNCPAQAISMEKGKEHPSCSAFLDRVREKCRPYYGCGKCQVNVPCENGIPAGKKR